MSIQSVETTVERQEWEDMLRDYLAGDPHLPEPPKTISRDVVKVD